MRKAGRVSVRPDVRGDALELVEHGIEERCQQFPDPRQDDVVKAQPAEHDEYQHERSTFGPSSGITQASLGVSDAPTYGLG